MSSRTIKRVLVCSLIAVPLVIGAMVLTNWSGLGTAKNQEGFRIVGPNTPLFNGTLEGIRFGATEALVADGVQRSLSERCAAGRFDVEDGSQYFQEAPTYLPPGATLSIPEHYQEIPDTPNPRALVCPSTGAVYKISLSYTFTHDNAPPGELHIIRVIEDAPYYAATATADQISTISLTGRRAVLIDTSIPGQLGLPGISTVNLIIPEPGGYLAVKSIGLPRSEVLKVAESLLKEGF